MALLEPRVESRKAYSESLELQTGTQRVSSSRRRKCSGRKLRTRGGEAAPGASSEDIHTPQPMYAVPRDTSPSTRAALPPCKEDESPRS
eukprot:scaffold803_cov310-Pinguiococcus_pyrenoidosus.AAC.211